ncbi:MAG TPA: YafY family protein [Patescibacteria group bacterium]|nr:YafY family protein [Patescibacteria group bacterium]
MSADRLLSILLILSNKGLVTGKQLAEHFDVSVRTIYRDIDRICQAGMPVAAVGGRSGGFYMMENYSLDNLFLSKGEFQTLMAVIDSLNVIFGKNQQFKDIVLKFHSTYKKEDDKNNKLNINMSHFSMEDELKEYLYIMNRGIEESKLLLLQYINRNMELSDRTVEPVRIEFSHGQWYLTGYCRSRNDYRKFKLVRIKKMRIGDSFVKRDITAEELYEIFHQSYIKNSIKIKLKFAPRIGDQLSEYFFKENIKRETDDSYIVEEYFPYEEGLIKFILSFGNECEVIEPEFLKIDIRNYLERILEKYND